jgi:DNA-binding MarR family transcriptional regulator
LERKGLAQRGTDSNDRRRSPLSLTDQRAGLIAIVPLIDDDDPLAQGLRVLGEEQSSQLLRLLRELVRQLSEDEVMVRGIAESIRQQSINMEKTDH